MASTADQPTVSETLECPVCLSTYNLTDRLPKALGCHHTFCSRCVDQVKSGTTINCPTCRRQSGEAQVAVNFVVTDVLSALCQECMGQKRVGKCGHCNQELCGPCQKAHAEEYHKSLVKDLHQLEGILSSAIDLSKGTELLGNENRKEANALDAITKAIHKCKCALEQLEKELKASIRKSKAKNVEEYLKWSKHLDVGISQAKDFCVRSKNDIGTLHSERISIDEMAKLKEKCQQFVNDLIQAQNNLPDSEDYKFVMSERKFDASSVGKIIIHERDEETVCVRKVHKDIPNYSNLRYKCLTGQEGSDLHQFNTPFDVVCTADKIVVADAYNHRIKWYDNDLNLQFLVGNLGSSEMQFNCPFGLAVGPEGEVYVSDSGNDRIKVLSKDGTCVREFGRKGRGKDKLNSPQGLAFRDDNLYICDRENYRVKVVQSNGTYVRQIGSKGQFQNNPIAVAVTSAADDRVLVKESKKNQLHVFNRLGEHKGLFPPIIPTELLSSIPRCAIAIDAFDNVLIMYTSGQLAVYNKEGNIITIIGSKGSQPGEFLDPYGLDVNTRHGYIFVADSGNHRIEKFEMNLK